MWIDNGRKLIWKVPIPSIHAIWDNAPVKSKEMPCGWAASNYNYSHHVQLLRNYFVTQKWEQQTVRARGGRGVGRLEGPFRHDRHFDLSRGIVGKSVFVGERGLTGKIRTLVHFVRKQQIPSQHFDLMRYSLFRKQCKTDVSCQEVKSMPRVPPHVRTSPSTFSHVELSV